MTETAEKPPRSDGERILALAHNDFVDLRGARIFMTGCTGFFGRYLLEGIQAANSGAGLKIRPTLLTRDPKQAEKRLGGRLSQGIEFWKGDVRSFRFPHGRTDIVIHGAANAAAALRFDHSMDVFEVLVDGTRRVLDYCRSAKASRILLLSSGAVYGPQPRLVARLSEYFCGAPSSIEPISTYGEGKRVSELLCRLYARAAGVHCVVARCFAFSGPGVPLNGGFAVGNFVRDALTSGIISIAGDGRPVRSYMDGVDLAAWLWRILLRGQRSHSYNVGSEQSVSIQRLALEIADLVPGTQVRVMRHPERTPPDRYVPSTRLSRAQLKLRQTISRRRSLLRTLAWARAEL